MYKLEQAPEVVFLIKLILYKVIKTLIHIPRKQATVYVDDLYNAEGTEYIWPRFDRAVCLHCCVCVGSNSGFSFRAPT